VKADMKESSGVFSSAAMNRIFWGALLLLVVKIALDQRAMRQAQNDRYLNFTSNYYTDASGGQGLRFDTKTVVKLMEQYMTIVTNKETAKYGVNQEEVADLLENLREERRRFYTYMDVKNRRPKGSLTSRENRTLRYYLYALEKAIRDLTGEERRRR
jgi:hypothetical protein